jgi:hypothetical protein
MPFSHLKDCSRIEQATLKKRASAVQILGRGRTDLTAATGSRARSIAFARIADFPQL